MSKQESDDQAKIAVVHNMMNAWHECNWDRALDLFTRNGAFCSMMLEPVRGREALKILLNKLGDGMESLELEVRNISVTGNVVMVERIDSWVFNGNAGSIPVVGVFEIEGEKVKEWREYFDREQLMKGMGLTGPLLSS